MSRVRARVLIFHHIADNQVLDLSQLEEDEELKMNCAKNSFSSNTRKTISHFISLSLSLSNVHATTHALLHSHSRTQPQVYIIFKTSSGMWRWPNWKSLGSAQTNIRASLSLSFNFSHLFQSVHFSFYFHNFVQSCSGLVVRWNSPCWIMTTFITADQTDLLLDRYDMI